MSNFWGGRNISRRSVFRLFTLAGIGLSIRRSFAETGSGQNSLVVLFTRTGNTRVVADLVRREKASDFFEIVPLSPYPEDYEQTVDQATKERESSYLPELLGSVEDIATYQIIYLAFPIWGMSVPPPVRSFLASHDLNGKEIVPLITHGGYGIGDALEIIKGLASNARTSAPFIMEGEQERRVIDRVRSWMDV